MLDSRPVAYNWAVSSLGTSTYPLSTHLLARRGRRRLLVLALTHTAKGLARRARLPPPAKLPPLRPSSARMDACWMAKSPVHSSSRTPAGRAVERKRRSMAGAPGAPRALSPSLSLPRYYVTLPVRPPGARRPLVLSGLFPLSLALLFPFKPSVRSQSSNCETSEPPVAAVTLRRNLLSLPGTAYPRSQVGRQTVRTNYKLPACLPACFIRLSGYHPIFTSHITDPD